MRTEERELKEKGVLSVNEDRRCTIRGIYYEDKRGLLWRRYVRTKGLKRSRRYMRTKGLGGGI